MASPNYNSRDYLLPKGCKDLVDVINLKGEIFVSGATSVGELAVLLGQKPFRIVADLMQLGIFATVNQVVGFATMQKVARKYGYAAKVVDLETMRKFARDYGYSSKRPS